MQVLRRPLRRNHFEAHRHPVTDFGQHGSRPACSPAAAGMVPMDATMSGPSYKGMDPSDPGTWVRPWEPVPGMISYLNFDGARYQDYTPTGGNQRGRQSRRRG